MKKKAFLDTTVLADALLKSDLRHEEALEAIRGFSSSELPVYAIKEFSAGPLQNFVWLHNKLVQTGSIDATLEALGSISHTPKRHLTSTAIEALRETFSISINSSLTSGDLVEKYGADANIQSLLYDRFRLNLKTIIFRAWENRRSVASRIVEELDCYQERSPSINVSYNWEVQGLDENRQKLVYVRDEYHLIKSSFIPLLNRLLN